MEALKPKEDVKSVQSSFDNSKCHILAKGENPIAEGIIKKILNKAGYDAEPKIYVYSGAKQINATGAKRVCLEFKLTDRCLELAGKDDAFEGIIGHETFHIKADHVMKIAYILCARATAVIFAAGSSVCSFIGGKAAQGIADAVFALGAYLVFNAAINIYRRAGELRADRFSVRINGSAVPIKKSLTGENAMLDFARTYDMKKTGFVERLIITAVYDTPEYGLTPKNLAEKVLMNALHFLMNNHPKYSHRLAAVENEEKKLAQSGTIII